MTTGKMSSMKVSASHALLPEGQNRVVYLQDGILRALDGNENTEFRYESHELRSLNRRTKWQKIRLEGDGEFWTEAKTGDRIVASRMLKTAGRVRDSILSLPAGLRSSSLSFVIQGRGSVDALTIDYEPGEE